MQCQTRETTATGGKFLRFLIFGNSIIIITHRFADSRCAFAAQGLNADTTINDSPLVFVNVDLNICGGYNATTGKPNRVASDVNKTICPD